MFEGVEKTDSDIVPNGSVHGVGRRRRRLVDLWRKRPGNVVQAEVNSQRMME